ncbi:MAG: Rab family GTPase [Candidatus Thorarchaeota archaeon]
MNNEKQPALFKVVVVGSGGVGKTSTILRYTTNSFRENYIPTLGAGFARKVLEVDGRHVTLQIWDLGGQEHLKKVRANFYAGAMGVLFVYDTTRTETLEHVSSWRDEVNSHLGEYRSVLLANKVDLVDARLVSASEGKETALMMESDYLETSAKLDQNVEEAFQSVASQMIAMMEWSTRAENE